MIFWFEGNEEIWYLKYKWKSVETWMLDGKKLSEALLWFDEMLRYFINKEIPEIQGINYEIPVEVKKGSVIIALCILSWTVIGWAYLRSVWDIAWKEWFLESWPAKDIKKILELAISWIQTIIKIVKHRKWENNRWIDKLKFLENNSIVWIPNMEWEYIYVTCQEYKLYLEYPEKLLSKSTKIIDEWRTLEIWLKRNSSFEKVEIENQEKHYFYKEEPDDIVILPELIHWEFRVLEWEITRTTESTNTIWFRYNWHTLICKPYTWWIATFKNSIISNNDAHFFSRVKIKWYIDRMWIEWEFKEKKPSILFTEIVRSENDDNTNRLF